MGFGPGKYGANAEKILKTIDADMVIVIVVGGPDGGAFDVATCIPMLLERIPTIIRKTADDIERTMRPQGRG